ncbi:nucleotidyltransferase [Saccharomonospora sp. CUA-673]|nr:nucleotidyltransferase [Saccharomonospora sp. CUA-673]
MASLGLPGNVLQVADDLADLESVVAVVLGGSRATGAAREDSDWDLGVYYRSSGGVLDPDDVRNLGYPGQVSGLGDWGPIVHGGGWLTAGGTQVDVLFRDLDVVEAWRANAEQGKFDVLLQAGCLVGAPTYLPVGELACCLPIHGQLDQPTTFPAQLAATAAPVWRGQAAVALMFARGYATIGDTTCCAGMLSQAVLCEAHARLAEQRRWALNEKRLITEAGLTAVQPLLAAPGANESTLADTIDAIQHILEIEAADKH